MSFRAMLMPSLRWMSTIPPSKTIAAALIERLPIIVPDMEPWEAEFEAMQADLDSR